MPEALYTGVGLTTGVGATMAVRRQFDQQGETTVLRPSVLFGTVTGALAIAVPWMMGMDDGAVNSTLGHYGEAALASAAFSAFNPIGTNVRLPTI